jgi:hypothetical protein
MLFTNMKAFSLYNEVPGIIIQIKFVFRQIKQEGHDGPEVAHLYIAPPHPRANFYPRAFI